MAKPQTVFDRWWETWLEKEHYYETRGVDETKLDLMKGVAKEAWEARHESDKEEQFRKRDALVKLWEKQIAETK